MNYTEAVRLARSGEEKGFTFLYESTYKSKYYLALQYMKNEAAAEDVLQDAYMKAFSKLDTLEKPETFPGWLGVIVANTAKNELARKTPMLFADAAAEEDGDGESFEYRIEDESPETQPETAYTRQETQELVHELIDSLSEEQRLCILMFHIEGISIREIAEAMNCSENTVKSRLNYGRKNLKIKAEELQKKGYKLYGIAPLPLLLLLLRNEEEVLAADGTLEAAGRRIARRVSELKGSGTAGSAAAVPKAAGKGFLHTMAGKAAVIAAGVCVAGGGILYGVSKTSEPAPEPETVQETPAPTPTPVEEPEATQIPETTEAPAEPQEAVREQAEGGATIKELYAGALQSVQNQEAGYEFPVPEVTGYGYFLCDLDGDGNKELVVGAEYAYDVFSAWSCRAFGCEETENGYALKAFDGSADVLSAYVSGDGNGMFSSELSRGTGAVGVYRITAENGALVKAGSPEYTFTMGDAANQQFSAANPPAAWHELSDLSAIEALE